MSPCSSAPPPIFAKRNSPTPLFSRFLFEAMDSSKAVLPLPPGMVPSASREDMTDLGEEQEDEDGVLKEVGISMGCLSTQSFCQHLRL